MIVETLPVMIAVCRTEGAELHRVAVWSTGAGARRRHRTVSVWKPFSADIGDDRGAVTVWNMQFHAVKQAMSTTASVAHLSSA